MNISLVSADAQVQHLCRQVVESLAATGPWTLCTLTELPPEHPGGVCIYDPPDTLHPEAFGQLVGRADILLVELGTLKKLRSFSLAPKSDILLKPLTRLRLEAALARFASPWSDGSNDSAIEKLEQFARYLLVSNIRYQELEQNRLRILADAIRELRRPLTPLTGYCDLILEKRLGGSLSSQQEAVMARMRRSLSRLTVVVSVMHVLLGEEQPDSDLPMLSEVGYTECVEHAVHELTPLIAQRRIDLSLDLMPGAGAVRADPLQIEEVFINLLDNSCKFTPRGGRLRISGYPYSRTIRHAFDADPSTANGVVPDSYRVDISGAGLPVEPERISHIFEDHTAICDDAERTGDGLGLAICGLIVKRHHGAIWAESSGQGTTFSIILPVV